MSLSGYRSYELIDGDTALRRTASIPQKTKSVMKNISKNRDCRFQTSYSPMRCEIGILSL